MSAQTENPVSKTGPAQAVTPQRARPIEETLLAGDRPLRIVG